MFAIVQLLFAEIPTATPDKSLRPLYSHARALTMEGCAKEHITDRSWIRLVPWCSLVEWRESGARFCRSRIGAGVAGQDRQRIFLKVFAMPRAILPLPFAVPTVTSFPADAAPFPTATAPLTGCRVTT